MKTGLRKKHCLLFRQLQEGVHFSIIIRGIDELERIGMLLFKNVHRQAVIGKDILPF